MKRYEFTMIIPAIGSTTYNIWAENAHAAVAEGVRIVKNRGLQPTENYSVTER